jgi:hypothetical protein
MAELPLSSCALTQNIPLDCRQSTGGIKKIFVTPLANQTAVPTTSGGTVTAYSLQSGGGFKFFEYDFRKATGSWDEKGTLSDANWSIFYAGDIKIQFTKMEVNKRNELYLLAQNDLAIIILDNNGQYWLAATTNGATLTNLDGKTGKNFGDLNGYVLEFKYDEPVGAFALPASFISGLTTAS